MLQFKIENNISTSKKNIHERFDKIDLLAITPIRGEKFVVER
jgi:hypothetical protein